MVAEPSFARRPVDAGTSLAESFAGADPETDAERLRNLRRMKAVALGFLVGATVIFLACRWGQAQGGPGWLGYLGAAAEFILEALYVNDRLSKYAYHGKKFFKR